MKAVKTNKVYNITETEKQRYINEGFDICDDNGVVIEYGRGKSVPFEDYLELKKKLEELQASDKEEKAPKKEKKEKAGDA